jgi:hypothetical protein
MFSTEDLPDNSVEPYAPSRFDYDLFWSNKGFGGKGHP